MELVEVNIKNAPKQYADYAVDNRNLTTRRFTVTVPVDAKYDVNDLIKDPTSNIFEELVAAKNRVIDRITISAAVGSVNVGDPTEALTSLSAASDGVITIDATSGLDYSIIQAVTQTFINNDMQYSDFQGSIICITGKENTDLMMEPQFTSNDYISAKVVDAGKMDSAGMYRIIPFAGSENGGITVSNPILPESTPDRSCVVLAPKSIAIKMQIGRMDVERNNSMVNTNDLTIELWIGAMRTEGARVIILTTLM